MEIQKSKNNGLTIDNGDNAIELLKKHSELVRMLDLLAHLSAIIIVLKYLLSPNKFSCFVDDINNAIENLLVSTRQLQQTQMYKYMGFPTNCLKIKESPYCETIDENR